MHASTPDSLDAVRRLEDAGAPTIVMHSLFEEQIVREEIALSRSMETPSKSYAEALTYFPEPHDFVLGPDEYLEQVRRIKATVGVPVIGSLNGTTTGGWTRYASLVAEAGADGLELDLYEVAADANEPGGVVERRLLDVVRSVKQAVASRQIHGSAHHRLRVEWLGLRIPPRVRGLDCHTAVRRQVCSSLGA